MSLLQKAKSTSIYNLYRTFFPANLSQNQWLRVVMNKEIERIISSLNYSSFDALEISGNSWEKFGFGTYHSLQFPTFDVCEMQTESKYDLIIAEQVFEHLKYPFKAARNIFEMLKPNGYFIISTPFLIKVHRDPIDCMRWTDEGLKYFLHECGFPLEKLNTYSWGNSKCMKANMSASLERWPLFRKYIDSLKNEPDFQLTVWGLAQK